MEEWPVAAGPDRCTFALFRCLKRRRKRDRAIYGALLLATLLLVYLLGTAPPPSISCETYARITLGMTQQEVERIVGTRPGGYEECVQPGGHLWQEWGKPQRWSGWGNGYGVLTVGYGADGRVCYKELYYDPDTAPERPELWPWWKRLIHRSAPAPEPIMVWTMM